MRLAIFGRNGQLATELQRRMPDDVQLTVVGSSEVDFALPDQVAHAMRHLEADVVINAAAYTQVDRAEIEPGRALTMNGHSVDAIATGCAAHGIPFVHLSTDYVFSGNGTKPWRPEDPPAPANAYGESKRVGEELIRESGVRHVILRTSWVFSAHGQNFVKAMLSHAPNHAQMSIVSDEIGGPTPAGGIAEACLTVARHLTLGHEGGTYHFAGTPDVSWADFAEEIFREAGLPTSVARITSAEWAEIQRKKGRHLARRPLNSRLDCSTLEADFGIRRPDWKVALKDVLKELEIQRA